MQNTGVNDNRTKPTWDEFAWDVFIYNTEEDTYYKEIMVDKKDILVKLRRTPDKLIVEEEIVKGIIEFLNKWKCRTKNDTGSAENLKKSLQRISAQIQKLDDEYDIITVDLISLRELINEIYKEIRTCLGCTATTKLLHIIKPRLFVMWDSPVREEYHKNNKQICDSEEGYFVFLQTMQEMAKNIEKEFQNTMNERQDLADYLSQQLELGYSKTLSKYLDEYNWSKITQRIKYPPKGKELIRTSRIFSKEYGQHEP